MFTRLTLLALAFSLAVVPCFPSRGVEPDAEKAGQPAAAQTAEWRGMLSGWRRWFLATKLDEERSPEMARQNILAIEDRAAVPALVAMLKTEKNSRLRLVLIEPLVKLAGKDEIAFLVKLSVEDANPPLREIAAKGLAGKDGIEDHLDTYIAYLKSPKYVANAAEALKWTRLAQPLSTVDKPNEKLTKALISALHTYEEKIVPYSVAFDSGVIGSLNKTNQIAPNRRWGTYEGMVRVKIPTPQPKVLEALQQYSENDYQYNEAQWNSWLQGRVSPP